MPKHNAVFTGAIVKNGASGNGGASISFQLGLFGLALLLPCFESRAQVMERTIYADDHAVFELVGGVVKLDHENIQTPYGTEGRVVSGGAVKYYIKDHLGSTRTVMNDAGAIEESQMYFSYGTTKALVTPSKGVREKFTGKEYDVDGKVAGTSGVSLNFFGARYYDPEIGLWISPDPANEFFNPYTYVGNNPIVLVDPTGESSVEVGGAGSISLGLFHFNLSAGVAVDPEAAINMDWRNTFFVKGAAGASVGPGFGASGRVKLGLSSESPSVGREFKSFREVVVGVGVVGGWKESADEYGNKSLDLSLGVGKELSGSVGVEAEDTKTFSGFMQEFFTGRNTEF